ncbi:MAG: site-specific integrase [Bacteroidales bacterium]|nr:site-specific integrase [Bacteroidales bacterium]
MSFNQANIRLENMDHHGIERVALVFAYDKALIAEVKQLPGANWSQSRRVWHIPADPDSVTKVLHHFEGKAMVDCSALQRAETASDQTNVPVVTGQKEGAVDETIVSDLLQFRQWLEHKRYSPSTINTYLHAIREFLVFTGGKPPHEITNADMVKFVTDHVIANGLSYSYQNQTINAAKLFFSVVHGARLEPDTLQRPRPQHRLPNVLSKEEVKAVLEALTNQKHRAMLSLIYGCGLRRSELLNLKPEDVDSRRHLLHIINAKGKKDRVVPLSDKLIAMLREYFQAWKPRVWLFEGQKAGEQYSETSLQQVLKFARTKADIPKPVTLHWLRHSYATHLLEAGTDLRYIQELLGHKSSRTTEIYTHVSQQAIAKIKCPFDDL